MNEEIKSNLKKLFDCNELMYTAVHEFTHHYLTTEKGDKGGRHNGLFWATFYDLLEMTGLYRFRKPCGA